MAKIGRGALPIDRSSTRTPPKMSKNVGFGGTGQTRKAAENTDRSSTRTPTKFVGTGNDATASIKGRSSSGAKNPKPIRQGSRGFTPSQ
jgi:hypothetical protein